MIRDLGTLFAAFVFAFFFPGVGQAAKTEQNCSGWAEVVIRERWGAGYTHEHVRRSFQKWLDHIRAEVKAGRIGADETWATDPKYEGVIFAMIDTAYSYTEPGDWKARAVAMCEEVMKMKNT